MAPRTEKRSSVRRTASTSKSSAKSGPRSQTASSRKAADAPPKTAAHDRKPTVDTWFPDIAQLMQHAQFPEIDLESVMNAQRRNIEALVAANQEAYQGMQRLAQRQAQILQEAVEEWQAIVGRSSATGAAPGIKEQADLAQRALTRAAANLRELAELATASQTRVFAVIQKRSEDNLAQLKHLFTGK